MTSGTLNYAAEAESKATEWLKLTPGQHSIKLLEEIAPPTKVKRVIKGEETEIEQSTVSVEVKGKTYKWTVATGVSARSTWKQLMKWAAKEKTVAGKTITVLVKADGDKKDITIMEAL